MLLIPLGVDVPMQRIPWMNWALMLLILFAFAAKLFFPNEARQFILGIGNTEVGNLFNNGGSQTPIYAAENSLSWIGHIFLHGGYLHVLGNLVFMWAFGNAVCAKIGNLQYGVFFIGVGVLGGVAHVLTSDAPVLGASGAINGVVGAFLILYPTNEMSVFLAYFLLVIFRAGVHSLRSFWMILYWFAWDILGFALGGGGVAYAAHLGGVFGGALVLVVLIKFGLFEAEEYEKNLLEVFAESRGREIRPLHVRYASEKPNPDMMSKRLHVQMGTGKVKHLPVLEFIRHEGQGKDVDHFVVSEDGRNWTTFADWRKANL